MITRALLWITRPKVAFERAGGLSVLERQLFTLSRAGITQVWVNLKEPPPEVRAGLRLPQGLEIAWTWGGQAPKECATPYLAVSGDHFLRVETLSYVAKNSYPHPTSFNDADGGTPLQVVAYRAEGAVEHLKQALPAGASVLLEPPLSRGPALSWLLATGPKSQDGFMARHFDRHISLSITRALLESPITPNLMTLGSCALGLVGAALFAAAHGGWDMLGAALIWAHSVLDGCDGELARIRFQESALGADIDFWADNVVHLALFSALAWGFYRRTGSELCLVLGASAAIGILCSAAVAFQRRRAGKSEECAEGLLARIETILAQRDFIYLLLAMAYLRLTYGFLWAGAVGAPLYLIVMLCAGRPQPAILGEST